MYSCYENDTSSFVQESYTETEDPFPVPKIPDNRIPTPWYIRNNN